MSVGSHFRLKKKTHRHTQMEPQNEWVSFAGYIDSPASIARFVQSFEQMVLCQDKRIDKSARVLAVQRLWYTVTDNKVAADHHHNKYLVRMPHLVKALFKGQGAGSDDDALCQSEAILLQKAAAPALGAPSFVVASSSSSASGCYMRLSADLSLDLRSDDDAKGGGAEWAPCRDFTQVRSELERHLLCKGKHNKRLYIKTALVNLRFVSMVSDEQNADISSSISSWIPSSMFASWMQDVCADIHSVFGPQAAGSM